MWVCALIIGGAIHLCGTHATRTDCRAEARRMARIMAYRGVVSGIERRCQLNRTYRPR